MGFWNTNDGYEFNLALIAAAAALIDAGPGSPSVDDALGLDLKGGGWALAALQAPATGSGRFQRTADSARQDVPAENPA